MELKQNILVLGQANSGQNALLNTLCNRNVVASEAEDSCSQYDTHHVTTEKGTEMRVTRCPDLNEKTETEVFNELYSRYVRNKTKADMPTDQTAVYCITLDKDIPFFELKMIALLKGALQLIVVIYYREEEREKAEKRQKDLMDKCGLNEDYFVLLPASPDKAEEIATQRVRLWKLILAGFYTYLSVNLAVENDAILEEITLPLPQEDGIDSQLQKKLAQFVTKADGTPLQVVDFKILEVIKTSAEFMDMKQLTVKNMAVFASFFELVNDYLTAFQPQFSTRTEELYQLQQDATQYAAQVFEAETGETFPAVETSKVSDALRDLRHYLITVLTGALKDNEHLVDAMYELYNDKINSNKSLTEEEKQTFYQHAMNFSHLYSMEFADLIIFSSILVDSLLHENYQRMVTTVDFGTFSGGYQTQMPTLLAPRINQLIHEATKIIRPDNAEKGGEEIRQACLYFGVSEYGLSKVLDYLFGAPTPEAVATEVTE